MGFGLLLTGYLLLVNIVYYGFTDMVAAALMLYALYKLSIVNKINKNFSRAFVSSVVFFIFSVGEFGFAVCEMFFPTSDFTAVISWLAIARCFLVCILTLFILYGIRDVSTEVELHSLAYKCERSVPITLVVYMLNIVAETVGIFNFISTKYIAMASSVILIATIILVVMNAMSIHSCFLKICMPGDEFFGNSQKPSRFEFVNKFRAHEERKRQEYTDYKINKMKAKYEKKKSKRNKK